VPAWTVVGPLAAYWQRYGFGPAKTVVWSGDNPCSLIGTGLVREGRIGVSLGTSDTIFGLMAAPRIDPDGAGHVFGAPTGAWMGLTCFRNGSIARERVRDAYGMDWPAFSAALAATPPGNGGAMMLPWFDPEITPTVAHPAVRRQNLDAGNGPANVRAVVEAQMMAIANHSAWMGVEVDAVHATGGAAVNRAILQVLADVLNADVHEFEVTNSAALGAALRAFQADRLAATGSADWDEVVAGFAEPARVAARPVPANVAVYDALRARYATFEYRSLEEAAGRWRPGL
jgi:xylulokinase